MRCSVFVTTSKLLLRFETEKWSFFAAPSPLWQSTHKWIILCLQDPQTVHQVHHYQITDWPDKGIPKNAQCILDVINMVERSQRKTSDAPLVVQCRWRKTELSFIFLLFLNWIYIERFRESLAISLLWFCRHVFSSLSAIWPPWPPSRHVKATIVNRTIFLVWSTCFQEAKWPSSLVTLNVSAFS